MVLISAKLRPIINIGKNPKTGPHNKLVIIITACENKTFEYSKAQLVSSKLRNTGVS